ncbi:hypothetical protein [Streptomyces demainii]|uniref:Uncharacterized protein n=1 Tax=Streptomyces demainii TaxID=588122 RepID=A0ABT9KJY5_9ACTN|nr:hypothetical protein [Streptomyces demainii]MDP9608739.1 hypothetical protein [Streptomyces demainii]
MLEEQVEPSGKLVLLEPPHRLLIGHREDVVEVEVCVDQARHHPALRRVDLLPAPQRLCRDGGDLSTVDGDVVRPGERLVAVEDVRTADDEVVRRQIAAFGARGHLGFMGHRSHS